MCQIRFSRMWFFGTRFCSVRSAAAVPLLRYVSGSRAGSARGRLVLLVRSEVPPQPDLGLNRSSLLEHRRADAAFPKLLYTSGSEMWQRAASQPSALRAASGAAGGGLPKFTSRCGWPPPRSVLHLFAICDQFVRFMCHKLAGFFRFFFCFFLP